MTDPIRIQQDQTLKDFLHEMTELARKYGVGIAGPFDLFNMERGAVDGDYEREYREDGRGKYEFF